MDYRHLMVDIETLDTKSNGAVIWIAAQFFNMDSGELGPSFTQAITISSNMKAGLNLNSDTALWWLRQEDALKAWANAEKKELPEALDLFSEFIDKNCSEVGFEIWGNSNRFDMGMLDNAYTRLGKKLPWRFRDERDVRTLVSFNPKIKEEVIKNAVESGAERHNPLVDVQLQIKYCVATYKTLKTCSCNK